MTVNKIILFSIICSSLTVGCELERASDVKDDQSRQGLANVVDSTDERVRTINKAQLQLRNDIAYEVNSSIPFTGTVSSYHLNGQISTLVHFINGKNDGLATHWHERMGKSHSYPLT